jgi:hypothetical protein
VPLRVTLVTGLCVATLACGCAPTIGASAIVSTTTDYGSGTGWSVTVGPDPSLDIFGGLSFSRTDNEFSPVSKVTWGGVTLIDFLALGFGVSAHWTTSDAWGIGPSLGIGIGSGDNSRVATLMVSGYLWLGSDGTDFDVGVEGSASVGFYMQF